MKKLLLYVSEDTCLGVFYSREVCYVAEGATMFIVLKFSNQSFWLCLVLFLSQISSIETDSKITFTSTNNKKTPLKTINCTINLGMRALCYSAIVCPIQLFETYHLRIKTLPVA